jgi:hypothetical protein
MTDPIKGNTFQAIDLGLDAWPQDNYPDFVKALHANVTTVKEQRRLFYDDLQRRYRWVNGLRSWMVWCTVGAGIATALSAIVRLFESPETKWPYQPPDVWLIVVAFILYALIAGLALYERFAEGSGHYFRAVVNILQIRDAWTDYQFKEAVLSLEPDPDAAGLVAMKTHWLRLAQTFVVALDKQATTELNEWHTAFSTALKDMSDNAATNLKATQQYIEGILPSSSSRPGRTSRPPTRPPRMRRPPQSPAAQRLRSPTARRPKRRCCSTARSCATDGAALSSSRTSRRAVIPSGSRWPRSTASPASRWKP